jgi:PAS domain S-box
MLGLRVNDRMCQMFGLTEDELRGRRLTDVLPGPQYDAIERYMRQVLDTGESVHRRHTAGYRVRPANAPGRSPSPR